MLDPKERQEMEDVLLHYGVKGMKWDKEKRNKRLLESMRKKGVNITDKQLENARNRALTKKGRVENGKRLEKQFWDRQGLRERNRDRKQTIDSDDIKSRWKTQGERSKKDAALKKLNPYKKPTDREKLKKDIKKAVNDAKKFAFENKKYKADKKKYKDAVASLKSRSKVKKGTGTKKRTKSDSFSKALEKAARKQSEGDRQKRKQHVDIANTMRDYAKTKEIKKKNDSFITKAKDKVTRKKLDTLGKYMEQRFDGKDTERLKMIAKMVNEKRNPWEKKKKKKK